MINTVLNEPITPRKVKARQIVELFHNGAKNRFQHSRRRIRFCQKLRRNLIGASIPQEFFDQFPNARDWIEVALPERQQLDLSITQSLGAREPVYVRPPVGSTDTAQMLADEYESYLNALREMVYPHDVIVGKAIQDGEFGMSVLPAPANMMATPEYEVDGKPDSVWDRDSRGRTPDHASYSGRSEKHSAEAYDEAYTYHLAHCPPFSVEVIPALDCVPIFRRGWHRQRWELQGLVRRSLFDREDLLKQKYRWIGQQNRILVPRGFSEDRASVYGADGQLWLYELLWCDEGGEPYIARCVGGRGTWEADGVGTPDDPESAVVIDLEDEYGLDTPMWSYHWGMHLEDDDPDFRGMPFIYPLVPTLLNLEGILTAANTQMWDNAFSGHVTRPDKEVRPETYMQGNDFRKFRKPRTGEIVLMPGPVEPFNGAKVGDDAWRMAESQLQLLRENSPSAQQYGGAQGDPSGHAMVVGYDLFTAGKRHVLDCGQEAAESVGYKLGQIAHAYARGDIGDAKINLPVYVTEQVEQDDGSARTESRPVEFKERWISGSYKIRAEYPDEENLAKIDLAFKLWQGGAGTWEDLQKARGKSSPETERIKVMRDQLMMSEAGQMSLQARVARFRGQYDMARKLDQKLAEQLTPEGLPNDALAPEFSGMGQGSGTDSMINSPDMAASIRGGIEAGQMATASRQADAAALMNVRSGGM